MLCVFPRLSYTESRRTHSDGEFSDILQAMGVTLVELQAPLFTALSISPILLFRTCQLQTSRFGRHFYIPVSPCSRLLTLLIYISIVLDAPRGRKTPVSTRNRIINMERSISCCTMPTQRSGDAGPHFGHNRGTQPSSVLSIGQIRTA